MSSAEQFYQEDSSSTTKNLIDFPNSPNSTTELPFLKYLSVHKKIEDIKNMVESKILELVVNDDISSRDISNNPFDSIYLCDLKPDTVEKNDIEHIRMLSEKITDKSNELIINDGLDD